jgi:GTPase SAR1 family protein
METLNVHNHFDTINASTHYQMGLEYPREHTTISTWNRSLSNLERNLNKAHEAPEAKVESKIEERRTCEDHSSGQLKDMSSSNTGVVQLNNQPLISPSPLIDLENVVATSSAVKADEIIEREYFMRCMVLGSVNTGKHSLISNISEEHKQPRDKSGANLVIKRNMQLKTTKTYHFWIRALGDASETKEAIWKTYYKWATAFVFVYDITNRESFEALEKAVKSVLEVIPQDKFFGILIGNKNDLCKERVVDYNEAANFKQKYNLNHFIETNSSREKEKSHIIPMLDTKINLIYESI